jgi:hypothetical protein
MVVFVSSLMNDDPPMQEAGFADGRIPDKDHLENALRAVVILQKTGLYFNVLFVGEPGPWNIGDPGAKQF